MVEVEKDKIKEFQELKEKEVDKEKIEENVKKDLKYFYDYCVNLLKYYIDMDEIYYNIIALWIVGTYFHKKFPTYPYLYINACKGSGKTRLLKLISHLSYNGRMQMDLTDATLFRLAENSTFCMDEMENINRREKTTLRLLLNAGYKRGVKVPRMTKQGDKQVLEEFEIYCPIAIANIWGLDDVLQDRCITISLERSSKKTTLKLLEAFPIANRILSVVSVDVVSCFDYSYQAYNSLIKRNDTNDTNNTNNTNNTNDTKLNEFFIRIRDCEIEGRNLELFFPLLLISWLIDKFLFESTLIIFERMAREKTSEDVFENKDIELLDYLYQMEYKPKSDFIAINEITNKFKEWLHETEEENRWVNTKWIGRSLKRSNVILSKRRKGQGREVIINFDKVRSNLAKFKELPSEPKEEQLPLQTPLTPPQTHQDNDSGAEQDIDTVEEKLEEEYVDDSEISDIDERKFSKEELPIVEEKLEE